MKVTRDHMIVGGFLGGSYLLSLGIAMFLMTLVFQESVLKLCRQDSIFIWLTIIDSLFNFLILLGVFFRD